MAFPRRSFLTAAALFTLAAPGVQAQTFPVKPVRIVSGFAPGGVTDIVGRVLAQAMTGPLGVQVLVENRPGAAGNIASELVAKSPPDGYTVMVASMGQLTVNQSLYTNLPFDPLRDFAAIGLTVWQPLIVVVNPSVPAKNIGDLVKIAKSAPNKLTYGSAGVGSMQHLSMELFRSMTGATMLHVPYKGGAPAVAALVGGHIDVIFDTAATSIRYVEEGKLRALAVTPGKRTAALPKLPTVDESGLKGYDFIGWIGLVAPAATPREVVTRLNAEMNKALATADVQKRLTELAFDIAGGTPEQFTDLMRQQAGKYSALIKKIGIKLE